ncbi:MAG TPA: hypothetical protein DCS91_22460 [Microcoleaceae bacterium UBA11344]|jgi:hypothetical protein|uniref:hypothetical protein n=1 Tax=Microcoleus sp. herbarium14 TaxID=3055439 RepID=UPI000E85F729|nr:hypothetical protein [Microcoleaceae cyanobacterium UBA11344]
MAEQTSFDLEDAKDLREQLQQFYETQRQEWSRVLSQWENLKGVWHDNQFDSFEPLFEKLKSTYSDGERECESYLVFLNQQIKVAEERRQKLGNLPNL